MTSRPRRGSAAAAAAIVSAGLLAGLLAGCGGAGASATPVATATPDLRDSRPLPSVSLPPTTATTGTGNDDPSGTDDDDDPTFAERVKPGWEVGAVAGQVPVPDSARVTCPRATRSVSDAGQLAAALAGARAGDVIALQPGRYQGEFVARASGTSARPIWLCGIEKAVLDGGSVTGGYVLHLDGASYWRLVGFTVTNGQKGVVADGVQHSVLQGLRVRGTGDEAIHLRKHSSDNVVRDSTVSDTGLRRDKFGEGIYVGSAISSWCSISGCQPDRSDRNVILGNTISRTSAEAVDIKEGTTGGQVLGNSLNGAGMVGADSWVDVKGDAWLIQGNTGVDSPLDGFQTHQILPGWGERNLFRDNVAHVNAKGYGFAFRPIADNVMTCDNVVHAAQSGPSIGGCG